MKFKILSYVAILLVLFTVSNLSAHCDGIDGPVVKSAQKSLEDNNVNYVLAWIKPEFEQEVKNVFSDVMSIRNQNEEIRKISDYYFFETVVRLHRLGEGEPYTGLKPVGREISPAIMTADLSIEHSEIKKIESLLIGAVTESIEEKFEVVMNRSKFNPDNIDAAREYVEAYVNYIHFAERVFELSQSKHSHGLH
ncbi:MAG: DUF6448 family protein [Ignavibacteriaceae bacterium]